ncbi:MAG: glycosyltransferase [Bdellovibrionales bacterium]|nr:glycosyltransferase [Bdellovibrionales bacterium]
MKVLLSRPDKIGDVILALHGAKQLKKYCPHFQVYMHVAEYTRPLVENVKFIDGVVGWEEDLESYSFDAVVDLMAKLATARFYASAKIPIRLGNAARWFRMLHTRTAYIRRSRALRNEAEYNWQLISLLDDTLHNTRLREHVTFQDLKEVLYPSFVKPYYCLFPGVTVSAQSWPLSSWTSLVRLLLNQTEPDIVVMLGPAEAKSEARLREVLPNSDRIHLEVVTDLRLAAGILKRCEGYVGPSTGITHLAGVVGAHGVGLYPEVLSMHPDRWAPFRSNLIIRSPSSRVTPEEVCSTLAEPAGISTPARSKLSAFVICRDEEKNIGRCLDSLSFADEILLVDSGSKDRTLEIARAFPKIRIIERHWPGHREQKQFALEQCKYKWVLNLDSDEELSSELKGQVIRILEEDKEGKAVADGFLLCRVVYYLNRWWDNGGWHPEYRMRFFQREKAQWGGHNPHEKAHVDGRVVKLDGYIYHYTCKTITDFIDTQNKFSSQSARVMSEQGVRSSISKMIVRPVFRFFKFYVIKLGFREGKYGFIQAVLEATYTFLKYAKLWEMQREEKRDAEVQTRYYPEIVEASIENLNSEELDSEQDRSLRLVR